MVAVLLVLLIGLGWLLLQNGPRVRLVHFDRATAESALHRGDSITVQFDRRLEDQSYEDAVSFSPEVRHSVRTSGQSLVITLEQNLLAGTSYELTVGPDIFDAASKPMSRVHAEIINIDTSEYVYISRAYGLQQAEETSFFADDQDDRLVLGRTDDTGEETLFTHPRITMHALSREYVAAAVREETRDELVVISLDDRTALGYELPYSGRIGNLSMSERGSVVLFTLTPDFDAVSAEYYDEFANRLYGLNLSTGDITPLTDAQDTPVKAYFVSQDVDGRVALIQDQDQAFLALSPFNDYEPIILGSHTASYGFGERSEDIVFRDNVNFSIYDVASAQSSPLSLTSDGFVRTIARRNDQIYIATLATNADATPDMITVRNGWQEPETVLWQAVDDSLMRDFDVSFDGRYTSIQLDPRGCQYDDLAPNSQCRTPQTLLYDTGEQQVVRELTGFDLLWVP